MANAMAVISVQVTHSLKHLLETNVQQVIIVHKEVSKSWKLSQVRLWELALRLPIHHAPQVSTVQKQQLQKSLVQLVTTARKEPGLTNSTHACTETSRMVLDSQHAKPVRLEVIVSPLQKTILQNALLSTTVN
jgi:hypothetical protein